MGVVLYAKAVYGFILDRYIGIEDLPDTFIAPLTVDEVAEMVYVETEEVSGKEYIQSICKIRFSDVTVGYPGNEYNEQSIIYVTSTEQSAYYDAHPLTLNPMTAEEKSHIVELAMLFGAEPQWLLYPVYG